MRGSTFGTLSEGAKLCRVSEDVFWQGGGISRVGEIRFSAMSSWDGLKWLERTCERLRFEHGEGGLVAGHPCWDLLGASGDFGGSDRN